MTRSCGASGCLDAQAPIRVSFLKLYQWPNSDAEFVKLMSTKQSSVLGRKPSCHESYACRQKYLRSYTFCRKETVAERTKKWLQEKKEKKRKGEKAKKDLLVCVAVKRLKRLRESCAAVSCVVSDAVFKCLFSCIAKVDVQEN